MIPFIDLKAQQAMMRPEIDRAIAKVLDDGQYILGQALRDFERDLSDFVGGAHALGTSSGTDALLIPLMAWGVGQGDAVFVPSFTYTATVEAIVLAHATPVFVDVDPGTFNIDVADLKAKIIETRKAGKLTPKAVMSVDLFGLPVDYANIADVAKAGGLHFLSDAAQGFGGAVCGRRVGGLADVTATSFFPAKPLGCYGDGGAVFTNDEAMLEVMRSVRTHGQGKSKYDIARVGLNARLDTLQAAILAVKLRYFETELAARDKLASDYSAVLSQVVETPVVPEGLFSSWAQYTLKLQDNQRDGFQDFMKSKSVPTMVYYPAPMHIQPVYAPFGHGAGSLPVSEYLCTRVVSIPMHGYVGDETRDSIIAACLQFFEERG
ncbi:MAG: DegT/DnrJ/EryC1/StrS family aminotransferase [Rhodobacterales bacterium]